MNYHNPETPKDGMIDLRLGHTLEKLRELPDEAVQCIVTSPPYWGLRAYGTDPQVWLNGHEPCAEHQWGELTVKKQSSYLMGYDAKGSTLTTGTSEKRRKELADIERNIKTETSTCAVCGAWRGELGLEPTPELYVEHLTQIFREARRVLRDDGTLWLNLGDSYVGNASTSNIPRTEQGNGTGVFSIPSEERLKPRRQSPNRATPLKQGGLKMKDLIGIPWRVAFALQADGWYLRSEIIWHKPNPMPESVTDRPTKAHEQVFLLAKSARYYYDADAIRETNCKATIERSKYHWAKPDTKAAKYQELNGLNRDEMYPINKDGRNKRSVWTVTTHPFKEAHFATFPPKLIEPMILAGCPVGGVVLDPFNGSGTTGLVATQLGRDYIGIELKPEYVEMTKRRLESVQIKAIG